MIAALSTGDWLTRRGDIIEKDVGVADALFRTFTGLQPQQNSDVHRKAEIDKGHKERQAEGMKLAKVEWVAGLRSADPLTQQDHFNNAFAILFTHGFPQDRLREFMSMANKGEETMVDSIDWALLMRHVPPQKQEVYNKAYETIQKLKQQKQGN